MAIRSSTPLVDGSLCALQGFIGAGALNAFKKTVVVNPLNGAVCLGGIALVERLFAPMSKRVITVSKVFFPPYVSENVISYSLATYTTLKAMHISKLIIAVHPIVKVAALASTIDLLAGCILMMGAELMQRSKREFK